MRGPFDDRAKEISRSVVRVLDARACRSRSSGRGSSAPAIPARRIGNEYLFQTLAEQNVETLASAEVTTVVANCPHCFNTLRNEYPDYGGRFEVVHHSQLFARLVAEGRLRPAAGSTRRSPTTTPATSAATTTCTATPRRALSSIPGVETVEMPRHGERALCCGAGGARMWMEERIGKRINQERVEEAASTGADTIAVSCPYCLIMLDDGARARTDVGRVEDLAQVLDRSSGAP